MILVSGANVWVIGRGCWGVAVGPIPWAVGVMFVKAVRYGRSVVRKPCVEIFLEGEVLDFG